MGESLPCSVSGSASTTRAVDTDHIILDSNTPEYSCITTEKCNKFKMSKFLSIEEAVDAPDNRFAVLTVPTIVDMKVASHPFDKGSNRAVYKAREYFEDGDFLDLVHKVYLSPIPKHLTRRAYEKSAILNQETAICFAENFAGVKPSSSADIRFTEVFLIEYLCRPNQPFCAGETELKGEWVKYNNNAGMVMKNHEIIQCFSHWTYQRSGGRMMVVDCQGVFNRATNSYLLTDPAIHCDDVLKYGGTNLGVTGFYRFFKTHKCNRFCRELSLTQVDLRNLDPKK